MDKINSLALKIAQCELIIYSIVLYALVMLARRYSPYLKDIDKIETQWMGLTMIAYSKDVPGPLRWQLLVLGYARLFLFSWMFWEKLGAPILEGLL